MTYLLAQSIDGAVEMEEEGGGFNGSNDSQFWEFKAEQGGEGERGKGGGDGEFQLVVKLVVERVRSGCQWPGLFIGRPCWFQG